MADTPDRPFFTHARALGLAIALVAVAAVLGQAAVVTGDLKRPHFFFAIAVALSAYRGGFVAGLVATGLSAVTDAYFFAEPRFHFRVTSPAEAAWLTIFILEGLALSTLGSPWFIRPSRLGAHSALGYLIAFAAVAGALLVKRQLPPPAREGAPFLLFYTAVVIGAWAGGLGPGLLATGLAAPAATFFFIEPFYSLEIGDRQKAWLLILFVAEGVGISLCGAAVQAGWRASFVARQALRRHEERLRRAQRLEAIGQMAGGIAHDFNNVLTAINGCCELLLHRPLPPAQARELVQEISRAGDRAAGLTRQLLAFSRRQALSPVALDFTTLVTETAELLRRLTGPKIMIVLELEPLLLALRADPSQLEQVLLNLVVNARDAMPDGGRIVVRTANRQLRPGNVYGAAEGKYVLLEVADTGCGMDEATQARVFEPFFTTKAAGQGTGLGLATVYGIVTQSRGHIAIESAPGKGTTIQVLLPASGSAERELPQVGAAPPRPTILVAEDDELVRRQLSRLLSRAGYEVLEAETGEAALRLAVAARPGIQLLVTDIVMPGLTGLELATRLRERWPDLFVLYLSGDPSRLRDAVPGEFLAKPYLASELLDCVARLLRR